MSTQSISPLENQNPFTTEAAEERREQPKSATEATEKHRQEEDLEDSYAGMKFVLDEPWRVKILPQQEPKRLPPGVLPKPEPINPRQQPWRMGDVTRLKDDSPEGMMKYIATHSTGWWQEMAQRALRDTERAERRAKEAGVEHGQYWTLELDVETREKLRLAEEARRARAEAERAKEEAAKEAFALRQRELLEKAGRAPRCEYQYTDGRGCRAPQVRGERWCHGHEKMMSYRPEKLELLPLEDEQAVTVNLYRVTRSLLSGWITEKMAGLMLWSVAIGAPGARRSRGIAGIASDRRDRKSKTLPLMNADSTDQKQKKEPQRTPRSQRQDVGHAGVRNDKSFKSGVSDRGTHATSSAIAASHKQESQSSVSQRLRGELRPLKSTELHRCTQGERENAATIMKEMGAQPFVPKTPSFQGLKPKHFSASAARLKSCPDTWSEESKLPGSGSNVETSTARLKSCPDTSSEESKLLRGGSNVKTSAARLKSCPDTWSEENKLLGSGSNVKTSTAPIKSCPDAWSEESKLPGSGSSMDQTSAEEN